MFEAATALYETFFAPAALILLLGTGLYLSVSLRFLPLRRLGRSIRSVFARTGGAGDISPFRALMASLSATLGTGNIAGVATAMVLGGSGALVWMLISAVLGMATKLVESVISVRWRVKNERGELCGGAMYALRDGLSSKRTGAVLAALFSVFTILASFGIGNITQTHTAAVSMRAAFGVNESVTGALCAIVAGIVIMGGVKRIGAFCAVLTPLMSALYIVCAVAVIIGNADGLGAGLAEMLRSAFCAESIGTSAAGGSLGLALRYGISRGVFSNEAGLGSSPIMDAAAKTDSPVRQGYIATTGVFFDTIVVCTLTGLAIAASGVLGATDGGGAPVTGVELTALAFETIIPCADAILAVSVALFAVSSVIGWSFYGEKALEYLTRSRHALRCYRAVYTFFAFLGATMSLEAVWGAADLLNLLMLLPNIVCIYAFYGSVRREIVAYQRKR